MFLVVLFVLGVSAGSFLNVLIDRLPDGTLFSKNRSYCESCHKTLKWYDLFPLISYLLLRGRCRYCKKSIPIRLFVVELITAIGFISIFLLTPPSLYIYVPLFLVIFCLLVAIFFIDVTHQIIPDVLLMCLVVTILALHILVGNDLLHHLITALLSCLFFLLLFIVTKGKGMGFGDVKFSFVIGLLLGFPGALVAFYSAFVIGAIASIGLIVTKKKKLKGSKIAFGPFLIIGILIALLFTDQVINLFL